MEIELSMNARAEVTTRYAKAYAKAAKGDKGRSDPQAGRIDVSTFSGEPQHDAPGP
jgi:hypothetical protein